MKRLIIGLASILFSIVTAFGDSYLLDGTFLHKDGRSLGMGGSMSSVENNPGKELSIHYLIPYQLKELSDRSLKVVYPNPWINLVGAWNQTGNKDLLENNVSLGVSKKLSKNILFGVKLGYYSYSTLLGEKAGTLWTELIGEYRLSPEFRVNVIILNPMGSKITFEGNKLALPQSCFLGGSYFLSKNTEMVVELEKTLNRVVEWHLGLEVKMGQRLFLRTGLSGQPYLPSWGLGYGWNHLHFSLGANSHPVLGLTSACSVYYCW